MSEPKLQPPGAGLPFLQRLLIKVYLGPFVSKRAKWDTSTAHFKTNCAKIQNKIAGLSNAQLQTKILVPPQMGLEDSSRYWSVADTLEHLVIVCNGMADIITTISHQKEFSIVVETKNVKPVGNRSPEKILAEFNSMCESTVPKIESKVGDRNSSMIHRHPWFGDFTARQWYWMMGVHMGLHYIQIKEIMKRLPSPLKNLKPA